MKLLFENWRNFLVEGDRIKGPSDFLYDITTSPHEIYIRLLDSETKEPVESKKEHTRAYIKLEKRIDVPHWEVAWSSSPKNSEKVGTIMYLMALELAPEGLSPDSYNISPSAHRIWGKFMKKNEYGVRKEIKKGHESESEADPFNFVFFKPNKDILERFSDNITNFKAESDRFDPKKEEEFEYFDPDTADWEEFEHISEDSKDFQQNVRKRHSKMKMRLLKKGKNQYNIGGKMKKPPDDRSKSSPVGFGGA